MAWLPERVAASLFDGYVVPDALAILTTGAARTCLFIERDLGTETARTVAAKVTRYSEIFGSTQDAPVNLGIVVDTARRASSVQRLLHHSPAASIAAWVIEASDLFADPYLGEWTGPNGRVLPTLGLPGEPAPRVLPLGPLCLVDSDAADAFMAFSARDMRALRRFIPEPKETL